MRRFSWTCTCTREGFTLTLRMKTTFTRDTSAPDLSMPSLNFLAMPPFLFLSFLFPDHDLPRKYLFFHRSSNLSIPRLLYRKRKEEESKNTPCTQAFIPPSGGGPRALQLAVVTCVPLVRVLRASVSSNTPSFSSEPVVRSGSERSG